MNQSEYIVSVASGSGGHIIPSISYIKKNYSDKKIVFLSSLKDIDNLILSNYSLDIRYNLFSRRFNLGVFNKVLDILHIFFNILYSIIILLKYKPAKVVHTGGITAIAVCIAARILNVDIETIELNAKFGKANILIARISNIIYTCFKSARDEIYNINSNVYIKEYPIRFTDNDIISKDIALNYLGLDNKKATILIIGGSKGSESINNILKRLIYKYRNYFKNINICHQTGMNQYSDILNYYKDILENNFIVFNYRHDINYFYSAADIIISRAGSGSIFEIIFFKKKGILIPLMFNDNHQLFNSKSICNENKDFIYFNEKDIDIDLLYKSIDLYLKDILL
jgi:UDP-N-acetylglucosamine--N-acetylmuramyl-(pentapeptide) pyrophosphoryl-undecaprenol N-acetylglucosamine transferase